MAMRPIAEITRMLLLPEEAHEGDRHFQEGRFEEAEAAFRKAFEAGPSEKDVYLLHEKLGDCLVELRRYDEAQAAFQASIGLNPDARYAHLGLGKAFESQGRSDEARQAYQRAVELDADNAAESLAQLEERLK